MLLSKFKDIHIPNFVLNGEILPRVSKCKYFGHIITEDISDKNKKHCTSINNSKNDNAHMQHFK